MVLTRINALVRGHSDIREIVLDAEDIGGNREKRLNTLPIAIGDTGRYWLR